MSLLMTPPAVEPMPRRWTREEFYRLAELGMFQGERAELIEGRIMVLSPQKWPHAAAVDRSAELLRKVWTSGVWVRMQLPLSLGLHSDPEPDISVVAGQRTDYKDHPTTALLIVEVSDTTLDYDRTEKAGLYAAAGITDYWIVNLVAQQVEVYRNPQPDASQPYGYRYVDVAFYMGGQSVNPLARPEIAVAVNDLLS